MTRKQKILVVDDDPLHLALARELLRENFDVAIHHNGNGVVARVRALQPDLLLIDVNMPDLRGDKIALQLRRDRATSHVPVVFYSSEDEQDLMKMVSSCHARGYICKSDIADLGSRVSRYLDDPEFTPLQ